MAHPIVDTIIDDSMPKELLLSLHTKFLTACSKKEECMLDYLKLSGVFWTLTALDLMDELDRIDREAVIELVISCQQSDGGLSPAPSHDSHLLSTLSGIQILTLYDCLDRLDIKATIRFVLSLQQPDGSFCGDQWGEIDTRFSFCAIASLHLLGQLEECIQSGRLNQEACAVWLERCQNLDGGFGTMPGSESHAGQAYCVVGALALLNELRRLDLDRAVWWLAERQLPSGGLNGRPEKKPDVCYSWWALASLTILGKLAWIDDRKLIRFILAAQDTDTGGIADRPGDMADPFHTLFGLAGLSLMAQSGKHVSESNGKSRTDGVTNGTSKKDDAAKTKQHEQHEEEEEEEEEDDIVDKAMAVVRSRVKTINPVFCMPQYVIDRSRLSMQLIS